MIRLACRTPLRGGCDVASGPWAQRSAAGEALVVFMAAALAMGCGKSEGSATPVTVAAPPGAPSGEGACEPVVEDVWEVFGVTDDLKDPFLNLRTTKSTRSKILAKLTETTGMELLKTSGKWRQVKIIEGEHADTTGWVHECCVKPRGAIDRYYAVLSAADHHNSKGKRLTSAAAIVRQDRANYHRFEKRDKRDRDDALYGDSSARLGLEKAFGLCASEELRSTIVAHAAEVWVTTYEGRVDVVLAKEGARLSGAKKKKKKSRMTPAACEKRHCDCLVYDGAECDDRAMKRCLKRIGVVPYECGDDRNGSIIPGG